jgi:hypothetical protein
MNARHRPAQRQHDSGPRIPDDGVGDDPQGIKRQRNALALQWLHAKLSRPQFSHLGFLQRALRPHIGTKGGSTSESTRGSQPGWPQVVA